MAIGDSEGAEGRLTAQAMAERLNTAFFGSPGCAQYDRRLECEPDRYEVILHLGDVLLAGDEASVQVLITSDPAVLTIVEHRYRKAASQRWAWSAREVIWDIDI